MEIKTTFKNLGKLEDVNFEDKDVNILLIQGPNRSGKTTARNAFAEAFSGENIKKDHTTSGKDSGNTEFHIPDKEGNIVIVKTNFNKFDEKAKFTITDKTGKTYKSKDKLREILGYYNTMSITDMFSLTRTTPGTLKFIKDFIYGGLSDEVKKQLEDIDKLIKPNSGTLYTDRTVKGRELAKAKEQPMRKFKENELKALIQLDTARYRVAKLQGDVNAYESKVLNIKAKKELVASNEKKIAEAEEEVKRLKLRNKAIKEGIEKIPDNIEEIKVNLEKGRKFVETVDSLESEKALSDTNWAWLSKIEEEHKEIEESILTYRKDRLRLLSSIKLPKGLIVNEETGKVTLNDREFTSTETSESEAMLILANIKCEMEEAKLIDMGNISIYDPNALKEISVLAKKYGKLVLLEKVEGKELKFVNYIVE